MLLGEVIGAGDITVTAEVTPRVHDRNRPGQRHVELFTYRNDGTVVRVHIGDKGPQVDATPLCRASRCLPF